jgi:Fe-S cluster assembly iron-binding protein IscA
MVRVTEQAATALEELLADNAAPPEVGVRLTPSGGGNLGMAIDAPHDGDEVISRDDETPLLIVDQQLSPGLVEMVVDFRSEADDHQTAGGFVLRPVSAGD